MKVIRVQHTIGARWLALSDTDHVRYLDDPAILDSLKPEACLDVIGGREEWRRPFGCPDSAEGRAAIRARQREREDFARVTHGED